MNVGQASSLTVHAAASRGFKFPHRSADRTGRAAGMPPEPSGWNLTRVTSSIQFEPPHIRCYKVVMLKPVKARKSKAGGGTFAIVASRYNEVYVDAMLRAATAEFQRAGAKVQIVRVPGAYEIPVVAARFAQGNSGHAARVTFPVSAVICLGVILRGETTHAAHIGEAVSDALMQIQITHGVPVIHEVLLLENEAQARVRCLGKKHNRGTEAAQTALVMAEVMRHLNA